MRLLRENRFSIPPEALVRARDRLPVLVRTLGQVTGDTSLAMAKIRDWLKRQDRQWRDLSVSPLSVDLWMREVYPGEVRAPYLPLPAGGDFDTHALPPDADLPTPDGLVDWIRARTAGGLHPVPHVVDDTTGGLAAAGAGRQFRVAFEVALASDLPQEPWTWVDPAVRMGRIRSELARRQSPGWQVRTLDSDRLSLRSPFITDTPDTWRVMAHILPVIHELGGRPTQAPLQVTVHIADQDEEFSDGTDSGADEAEDRQSPWSVLATLVRVAQSVMRGRDGVLQPQQVIPQDDGYLDVGDLTAFEFGHYLLDTPHVQASVKMVFGLLRAAFRGDDAYRQIAEAQPTDPSASVPDTAPIEIGDWLFHPDADPSQTARREYLLGLMFDEPVERLPVRVLFHVTPAKPVEAPPVPSVEAQPEPTPVEPAESTPPPESGGSPEPDTTGEVVRDGWRVIATTTSADAVRSVLRQVLDALAGARGPSARESLTVLREECRARLDELDPDWDRPPATDDPPAYVLDDSRRATVELYEDAREEPAAPPVPTQLDPAGPGPTGPVSGSLSAPPGGSLHALLDPGGSGGPRGLVFSGDRGCVLEVTRALREHGGVRQVLDDLSGRMDVDVLAQLLGGVFTPTSHEVLLQRLARGYATAVWVVRPSAGGRPAPEGEQVAVAGSGGSAGRAWESRLRPMHMVTVRRPNVGERFRGEEFKEDRFTGWFVLEDPDAEGPDGKVVPQPFRLTPGRELFKGGEEHPLPEVLRGAVLMVFDQDGSLGQVPWKRPSSGDTGQLPGKPVGVEAQGSEPLKSGLLKSGPLAAGQLDLHALLDPADSAMPHATPGQPAAVHGSDPTAGASASTATFDGGAGSEQRQDFDVVMGEAAEATPEFGPVRRGQEPSPFGVTAPTGHARVQGPSSAQPGTGRLEAIAEEPAPTQPVTGDRQDPSIGWGIESERHDIVYVPPPGVKLDYREVLKNRPVLVETPEYVVKLDSAEGAYILETVTKHDAGRPGDTGPLIEAQVLAAFADANRRQDDVGSSPQPVTAFFPADTFDLHPVLGAGTLYKRPDAEAFGRSASRTPAGAESPRRLYIHDTRRAPMAGLGRLLGFARDNTWSPESQDALDTGSMFTTEVTQRYINQKVADLALRWSVDDSALAFFEEVASLYAEQWLTFTHSHAHAHHVATNKNAKNLPAAPSRMALFAAFEELPPAVRQYLHAHRDRIRSLFTRAVNDSHAELADGLRRRRPGSGDGPIDVLSTPILDREGAEIFVEGRGPVLIGDYFDGGLVSDPPYKLDHKLVLGVGTHYTKLEHSPDVAGRPGSSMPLMLLEFRRHKAPYVTLEAFLEHHAELTRESDAAYRLAEHLRNGTHPTIVAVRTLMRAVAAVDPQWQRAPADPGRPPRAGAPGRPPGPPRAVELLTRLAMHVARGEREPEPALRRLVEQAQRRLADAGTVDGLDRAARDEALRSAQQALDALDQVAHEWLRNHLPDLDDTVDLPRRGTTADIARLVEETAGEAAAIAKKSGVPLVVWVEGGGVGPDEAAARRNGTAMAGILEQAFTTALRDELRQQRLPTTAVQVRVVSRGSGPSARPVRDEDEPTRPGPLQVVLWATAAEGAAGTSAPARGADPDGEPDGPGPTGTDRPGPSRAASADGRPRATGEASGLGRQSGPVYAERLLAARGPLRPAPADPADETHDSDLSEGEGSARGSYAGRQVRPDSGADPEPNPETDPNLPPERSVASPASPPEHDAGGSAAQQATPVPGQAPGAGALTSAVLQTAERYHQLLQDFPGLALADGRARQLVGELAEHAGDGQLVDYVDQVRAYQPLLRALRDVNHALVRRPDIGQLGDVVETFVQDVVFAVSVIPTRMTSEEVRTIETLTLGRATELLRLVAEAVTDGVDPWTTRELSGTGYRPQQPLGERMVRIALFNLEPDARVDLERQDLLRLLLSQAPSWLLGEARYAVSATRLPVGDSGTGAVHQAARSRLSTIAGLLWLVRLLLNAVPGQVIARGPEFDHLHRNASGHGGPTDRDVIAGVIEAGNAYEALHAEVAELVRRTPGREAARQRLEQLGDQAERLLRTVGGLMLPDDSEPLLDLPVRLRTVRTQYAERVSAQFADGARTPDSDLGAWLRDGHEVATRLAAFWREVHASGGLPLRRVPDEGAGGAGQLRLLRAVRRGGEPLFVLDAAPGTGQRLLTYQGLLIEVFSSGATYLVAREHLVTPRVRDLAHEIGLAGTGPLVAVADELGLDPMRLALIGPELAELAGRSVQLAPPTGSWVDGLRDALAGMGVRTDNDLVWLVEFAGRQGLGRADWPLLEYFHRQGLPWERLHDLPPELAERAVRTARWRMELAADPNGLAAELGEQTAAELTEHAAGLGVAPADLVVALGGSVEAVRAWLRDARSGAVTTDRGAVRSIQLSGQLGFPVTELTARSSHHFRLLMYQTFGVLQVVAPDVVQSMRRQSALTAAELGEALTGWLGDVWPGPAAIPAGDVEWLRAAAADAEDLEPFGSLSPDQQRLYVASWLFGVTLEQAEELRKLGPPVQSIRQLAGLMSSPLSPFAEFLSETSWNLAWLAGQDPDFLIMGDSVDDQLGLLLTGLLDDLGLPPAGMGLLMAAGLASGDNWAHVVRERKIAIATSMGLDALLSDSLDFAVDVASAAREVRSLLDTVDDPAVIRDLMGFVAHLLAGLNPAVQPAGHAALEEVLGHAQYRYAEQTWQVRARPTWVMPRMRRHRVAADGNCLPASIVASAEHRRIRLPDGVHDVATLQQYVADRVRTHPELFPELTGGSDVPLPTLGQLVVDELPFPAVLALTGQFTPDPGLTAQAQRAARREHLAELIDTGDGDALQGLDPVRDNWSAGRPGRARLLQLVLDAWRREPLVPPTTTDLVVAALLDPQLWNTTIGDHLPRIYGRALRDFFSLIGWDDGYLAYGRPRPEVPTLDVEREDRNHYWALAPEDDDSASSSDGSEDGPDDDAGSERSSGSDDEPSAPDEGSDAEEEAPRPVGRAQSPASPSLSSTASAEEGLPEPTHGVTTSSSDRDESNVDADVWISDGGEPDSQTEASGSEAPVRADKSGPASAVRPAPEEPTAGPQPRDPVSVVAGELGLDGVSGVEGLAGVLGGEFVRSRPAALEGLLRGEATVVRVGDGDHVVIVGRPAFGPGLLKLDPRDGGQEPTERFEWSSVPAVLRRRAVGLVYDGSGQLAKVTWSRLAGLPLDFSDGSPVAATHSAMPVVSELPAVRVLGGSDDGPEWMIYDPRSGREDAHATLLTDLLDYLAGDYDEAEQPATLEGPMADLAPDLAAQLGSPRPLVVITEVDATASAPERSGDRKRTAEVAGLSPGEGAGLPGTTRATLEDLEHKYFPPGSDLGTAHHADTVVTTHVDGVAYFGAIADVLDTLHGPGDRLYVASWHLDVATRLRGGEGEPDLGQRLRDLAGAGVDVRVIVAVPRHSLSPFEKPVWRWDFWRSPLASALRQYSYPNIDSVRRLRGTNGVSPLANRVLVDWSGGLDTRHEKLTIAYSARSGELHAFVGGMDYVPDKLASERHTGTPKANWHDVGVQLTGGGAESVLDIFWTRWRETGTLPERMYWLNGARKLFNPGVQPPPHDLRPPRSTPPVNLPTGSHLDVGVRIWRSYGRHKVTPLGGDFLRLAWNELPSQGIVEVSTGLLAAINTAKRYIYVEDQTLNPAFFAQLYNQHRALFPAIAKAAARGVKVVFVTQGFAPNSPPADATPGMSTEIKGLIRGKLTAAQRKNFALFYLKHTKVHAKVVLVDDEFASIGSANFWDRSMNGDESEVTAAIVHPGGPASLVADLRVQLWREHLRLPRTESAEANLRDLDVSLGYFHHTWGSGTASDVQDSALREIRSKRLLRWARKTASAAARQPVRRAQIVRIPSTHDRATAGPEPDLLDGGPSAGPSGSRSSRPVRGVRRGSDGVWLADSEQIVVRLWSDRRGVAFLSDEDLSLTHGEVVPAGTWARVLVKADGDRVRVPVLRPDGTRGTVLLTAGQLNTVVADILATAFEVTVEDPVVLASCGAAALPDGLARQYVNARAELAAGLGLTAGDVLASVDDLIAGSMELPGELVTVGGRSWVLLTPDDVAAVPWDVVNDERPFDGIRAADVEGVTTGVHLAPDEQGGVSADAGSGSGELVGLDEVVREEEVSEAEFSARLAGSVVAEGAAWLDTAPDVAQDSTPSAPRDRTGTQDPTAPIRAGGQRAGVPEPTQPDRIGATEAVQQQRVAQSTVGPGGQPITIEPSDAATVSVSPVSEAELVGVVDRVAGDVHSRGVLASVDDRCVAMNEAVLDVLVPGGVLPAVGKGVDDQVGGGRQGHGWVFGPGGPAVRVDSWQAVAQKVPMRGRSFAVVRWGRQTVPGHEVLLYRTGDGTLWLLDPLKPKGQRVRPWDPNVLPGPEESLSAVVAGPDGRVLADALQPVLESRSDARLMVYRRYPGNAGIGPEDERRDLTLEGVAPGAALWADLLASMKAAEVPVGQRYVGVQGPGAQRLREMLGPDMFGRRIPDPAQPFLTGFFGNLPALPAGTMPGVLRQLPASKVAAFHRGLSMTRPAPARQDMELDLLTSARVASAARDPRLRDWVYTPGVARPEGVPVLGTDILRAPLVVPTFWLGSPFTDKSQMGEPFNRKIAQFMKYLAEFARDYRGVFDVVLYTEIDRKTFDRVRELADRPMDAYLAEVWDMLTWARGDGRYEIQLINVDEVLNAELVSGAAGVFEPELATLVSEMFAIYRMEVSHPDRTGFAKAAEILRFLVPLLFGGLNTDLDNAIEPGLSAEDLIEELEDILAHRRGFGVEGVGDALFAPAGHPFLVYHLREIRQRYDLTLDQLFGGGDQAAEEKRRRRSSTLARIGIVPQTLRKLFGAEPPVGIEFIWSQSAGSWTASPPGKGWPADPQRTLGHAMRYASTLIRQLRNLRGRLDLLAVADAVALEPDQATVWYDVLRYLADSEFAPSVTSVVDGKVERLLLLPTESSPVTPVDLPPPAADLLVIDTDPDQEVREARRPGAPGEVRQRAATGPGTRLRCGPGTEPRNRPEPAARAECGFASLSARTRRWWVGGATGHPGSRSGAGGRCVGAGRSGQCRAVPPAAAGFPGSCSGGWPRATSGAVRRGAAGAHAG